jgi:hypothetical protein
VGRRRGVVVISRRVDAFEDNKCPHCGGDLSIRNPTGKCDHLYYPELCPECSALKRAKERLMTDTSTESEHRAHHARLHMRLDELVADYYYNTGRQLADTSVLELMDWSRLQCSTAKGGGRHHGIRE